MTWGDDANPITEVACRAVVPLPSVSRRVVARLVVALLALALLVPAAGEANDSPSFKAGDTHAVVAKKKKKRKRCKKYRWVRVVNEDIGEPGCKHWHVRPRWGVLGMLMNWWRVVISSGCPLAT